MGWLIAMAAAVLATGCAGNHDQLVEFLRSHDAEVSTGRYVVRPPDGITIHAPGATEIDGVTQIVRADGKVVLRLLGEVDVAGLTTEEIAAKLKAQLARYYVDPEVVVEVSEYNSQFYYVFGEVGHAGPKRYTGRDTLVHALADAQPTFLAWRTQIRLVRPSDREPQRKTITVDLDHMLNAGDLSQNVLLQEGDIVQVPPTPLAWLGLRVRELLFPVEPVLDAYNAPASAIESHHTYEDEFGSNSSNDSRPRRRF
jgi:protein involved in polysaccharide export with SLBB domain